MIKSVMKEQFKILILFMVFVFILTSFNRNQFDNYIIEVLSLSILSGLWLAQGVCINYKKGIYLGYDHKQIMIYNVKANYLFNLISFLIIVPLIISLQLNNPLLVVTTIIVFYSLMKNTFIIINEIIIIKLKLPYSFATFISFFIIYIVSNFLQPKFNNNRPLYLLFVDNETLLICSIILLIVTSLVICLLMRNYQMKEVK